MPQEYHDIAGFSGQLYFLLQENQHLYIVMNLIEGAQLSEHITSLKEKSMKFTEERLWYIFMQVCRIHCLFSVIVQLVNII